MKRDWDLVRSILQRLEEARNGEVVDARGFDGHESSLVAYHMAIMGEAGIIDARTHQDTSGFDMGLALRMTWKGHEFYDSIREDKVWNKVKQSAIEKGIELTFDLIGALAGQALRSMMGLPPA